MATTTGLIAQDLRRRSLQHEDAKWKNCLESLQHDVYHLREYLAVEGRRLNARPAAVKISDDSVQRVSFIPFLVRKCEQGTNSNQNDSWCDVISPYGYESYITRITTGDSHKFLLQAMKRFVQHRRANGICTAFLRLHPILNSEPPHLLGLRCERSTTPTISFNLRRTEDER